MVAIAIGRMGMGLETFLSLTPDQFRDCYMQFLEAEKEKREADELARWQVARWQVWRSLCPPQGKKLSQFDMITLPGDDRIKQQIKDKKAKSKRPERDPVRFEYLAKKWGSPVNSRS